MGFVPNIWGNWASQSLMRIFRIPSNQPWAEKHFIYFFLQPSFLIDPFRHITTSNLSGSSRAVTLLIRHSKSPVSALRPPLYVALRCDPPPLERSFIFSCVVCSDLRSAHSRFGSRSYIDAKRLACRCWSQMDPLRPFWLLRCTKFPQRDDCSTSECLHHRPPRSPQSVSFFF